MEQDTTIQLPHLPQHPIHISLFKNVQNSAYLREQLLSANAEFEYAFVDAEAILSVNQVLAAVFRAINDMKHDRLKSRNIHSEIVFSLSPNNNIAESFRRFGITSTSSSIVAIKVYNAPTTLQTIPDPSTHLGQVVQGNRTPFSNECLASITDIARVRKIYKLNPPEGSGKKAGKKANEGEKRVNGMNPELGEIEEIEEMERVILGMMAIKGS